MVTTPRNGNSNEMSIVQPSPSRFDVSHINSTGNYQRVFGKTLTQLGQKSPITLHDIRTMNTNVQTKFVEALKDTDFSYHKTFYIPKTARDNLLENDLKESGFLKPEAKNERRDQIFSSLIKDVKTL